MFENELDHAEVSTKNLKTFEECNKIVRLPFLVFVGFLLVELKRRLRNFDFFYLILKTFLLLDRNARTAILNDFR